jgi:hypothetical protein
MSIEFTLVGRHDPAPSQVSARLRRARFVSGVDDVGYFVGLLTRETSAVASFSTTSPPWPSSD